MAALSVGTRLGPYEVLAPIGAGGMGEVYRARDTRLGRIVAIKVLRAHTTRQGERRQRFEREARTISTISHPHVCALYDVGHDVGIDYLVMEYLEGQSLAQRLVKGRLGPAEALELALQIAEGLAEAHGRGIVHRDLKPANVMVSATGHAKILDFGLARRMEEMADSGWTTESTPTVSVDLSGSGLAVGTIAYMSPEQARGEDVDSRSDVFAFGVMLYELLAGRVPFKGESATSTIAKILESEPEPLANVRPDLPSGLARVVRRCLQKKPEARYNDTRDLVAELKELRHELASGEAARRPAPFRPALRARNWAFALGAATMLTLVGSLGLHFRAARPGPLVAPSYKQVTFSGKARLPGLSPDGRSLAFVESDGGQERLMVQDVAVGAALELHKAWRIQPPQWSPDSTEILACTRSEKTYEIVLVPRLGGPPRRYPYGAMVSMWSSDGSAFALGMGGPAVFSIMQKDTGAARTVKIPGPYTWLYLMDWSATNRLMFLARDAKNRTSLWSAMPDGAQHLKLHEEEGIQVARWSAAADAIYYLRARQETMELCRLAVDPATGRASGEPLVLLPGLAFGAAFTISRDGRRLAQTRMRYQANLGTATLGSSPRDGEPIEPHMLTAGTFVDEQPRLSPDGSRIAFARGQVRSSNIFVMPFDGGAEQQLTFLGSRNTSPAWAPDGKQIAFASMEGGTPHVRIVTVPDGRQRALNRTRLSATFFVSWAPGARLLYHHTGNRNFAVLEPSSESEQPLLADESFGWVFEARFAPQGDRVALQWNRGDGPGLWNVPVGGGDAPLRIAQSRELHPIEWSADGRSVFVFDANEARLLAVDSNGKGTRTLARFAPARGVVETLHVDPAARRVVLSIAESESDVWIVDNFDPAVKR